MENGAVIIARAEHASLERGPATSRTSQRVARQVIRSIEDHGINQLKNASGLKNAGPTGASRLPIEDNAEDNKIYVSINKRIFMDIFPLDVSHVQKE